MPTYVTNEAQFEIGEGWDDQSLIAFAAPGTPPRIGLVITKQVLREGETAEVAIETHLRAASQKLRRYVEHERKERTVGGLKGWEARFSFSQEGVAVYERQIFAVVGTLIWVLTASGLDSARADVDAAADKLIGSIKFRRPT